MLFEFKPLTPQHFDLLFGWLQQPHIRAWWDSETDRDVFELRHRQMINDPLVFPHIVLKDGQPIGYINYWKVEEDPNFRDLYSEGTVGIDQFVGVPELIGRGIGSGLIRQFTDELLARKEIDLVITDPDVRNLASIRACEKAGFKKTRVVRTSEGEVQVLEKSAN